MKIAWIAAAERLFSDSRRRSVFGFFGLFDGSRDWHPISTAPFNRDIQTRVAGDHGLRIVPFPCRQTTDGWINSDLGVRMEMEPVEWRTWPDDA